MWTCNLTLQVTRKMWLRNLFDQGDEIPTDVWWDKGDNWSPKDVFKEEGNSRTHKFSREDNFVSYANFGLNREIKFLCWFVKINSSEFSLQNSWFAKINPHENFHELMNREYWSFCLIQCLLNYVFWRPSIIQSFI